MVALVYSYGKRNDQSKRRRCPAHATGGAEDEPVLFVCVEDTVEIVSAGIGITLPLAASTLRRSERVTARA